MSEFIMNREIADTLGVPQLVSPTYEGRPILSGEQADACERLVKEWLGEYGNEARRYAPGHEGPMWVISLEGGPEDWPMQACEELRDKWPVGVFAEPVASWCLGLYPA